MPQVRQMCLSTLLVCSVLLVAVHLQTTSAQNRGQCIGFSNAISAYPLCGVPGYSGYYPGYECTSVRCVHPGTPPVTLTLDSCSDPPEVYLLFGDSGTDSFWTQSFAIASEETRCDTAMSLSGTAGTADRLSATFSRNASHINFQANVTREGDIAYVIIPDLQLPLDILSCTCYALNTAADQFHLDIPGIPPSTCYVNDSTTCSDFRCTIHDANSWSDSNAVIDPCTQSVTVTVTNLTRAQVWREVFSQNRSVQLNLNGITPTLYVMIRHFNYSMTISVKISIYGSYNSTIIPERRIVLDRSSCSRATVFPAAPFPYGYSDGCLTDDPDEYDSHYPEPYPTYPDYPSEYPGYPDYPSEYPGYPDYPTYPTFPTGFPTDYPYPTYPTNFPHPPTSAPNSGSQVKHAKTCQALQNIASGSASQCSVVDSCTAVDCNFMGQYHAKLTVKTCENPPAVGVVIRDFTGDTIVNETLVDSRTQPIQLGGVHFFDLQISITHERNPDSIILKVSIHTLTGQDIVVLPETPIPIDRCGCPGVACSSGDSSSGDSSSGGSSSGGSTGKHSSSLVKILVPVGVVVLLLVVIAVVVAVVVGVVIAKKKRGSGHNFQRMAFNTATEDVDEQ